MTSWITPDSRAPAMFARVSTQMTDVRRIEKSYGDLDHLPDGQTLATLRASLGYTKADERAGRPNPSRFEIDGNLYDGLAHFRATLNFYQRFLAARAIPRGGATLNLTAQDILAAIGRCDVAGSVEAFIASHEGLGSPAKFWLLHRGRPGLSVQRPVLQRRALRAGSRRRPAVHRADL